MPGKIEANFILTDCGELLTMAGGRLSPRRAADLSRLKIINGCSVAALDGIIVWVGADPEAQVTLQPGSVELSARGRLVSPGLVDAHTHPVFAATRELEFEMRALGKSYAEIAAAGGGIVSSVKALRAADHQQLVNLALPRLDTMLKFGTTTVEAKSGYGLSVDDEIKMLEVIAALAERHVLDLVPTVLAGHEFPPEYRDDHGGYVRLITAEILPAVAERKLAEFSDVFYEQGVFNREQARTVQQKARELGLQLKFHVDQLTNQEGASLAAEMGAISADHLEYVSSDGIAALAVAGTFGVLLPGAGYFLDMPQRPPVRQMIEAGVPLALATDCNPGSCMSESMQLMMNLACVTYKMTPAEAFCAATTNAAWSIGRGDRLGSVEIGQQADLVVWDADNYRQVPYHFGVNLVRRVIKKGRVVA